MPDFVAVVKQDKGFTAPSGQLAVHLANFFQNKTEIEYDVLVDKMKEVPEDQIFNLLGIKPKNSESSSGNDGSDELDKNKLDDITPEEEAEADSFMKELAEKGKKNEVNSTSEEAKKINGKKEEKKPENGDENKGKKSPVKGCYVNMQKRVPNKSPVKVGVADAINVMDSDSDIMIISEVEADPPSATKHTDGGVISDTDDLKGKEVTDTNPKRKSEDKLPTETNAEPKKRRKEEPKIENVKENDVTKSEGNNSENDSGVKSGEDGFYFSDSSEFRDAVETAKQRQKEAENDGSESEVKSGEDGVYFSDSSEFRDAVERAKQRQKEAENDGSESEVKSSEDSGVKSGEDGFYFSDSSEFRDAVETAKQRQKEAENDGSESEVKSGEDGVYFSDSSEFRDAVKRSKQSQKEAEDDGSESEVKSSEDGVYFSDSSDFNRKVRECKERQKLKQQAFVKKPGNSDLDLASVSSAEEKKSESSGEIVTDGVTFSDEEQFAELKEYVDEKNLAKEVDEKLKMDDNCKNVQDASVKNSGGEISEEKKEAEMVSDEVEAKENDLKEDKVEDASVTNEINVAETSEEQNKENGAVEAQENDRKNALEDDAQESVSKSEGNNDEDEEMCEESVSKREKRKDDDSVSATTADQDESEIENTNKRSVTTEEDKKIKEVDGNGEVVSLKTNDNERRSSESEGHSEGHSEDQDEGSSSDTTFQGFSHLKTETESESGFETER